MHRVASIFTRILPLSADTCITEEETEALLANKTTSLFVDNVSDSPVAVRHKVYLLSPTHFKNMISYRYEALGERGKRAKQAAPADGPSDRTGENRTIFDRSERHVPADLDACDGAGERQIS